MSGPLRVLLSIDVRQGHQEEFERLWHTHAAAVAELPENLGQSLHRESTVDTSYVVLSDWVDEPAFRAFERSARQQEYLRRLWPMRAGGSMRLLRVLERTP